MITGVKRSILLAVVQDLPESHTNLNILFELTGLNEVAYTFHADFKLLLYAIGKFLIAFIFIGLNSLYVLVLVI